MLSRVLVSLMRAKTGLAQLQPTGFLSAFQIHFEPQLALAQLPHAETEEEEVVEDDFGAQIIEKQEMPPIRQTQRPPPLPIRPSIESKVMTIQIKAFIMYGQLMSVSMKSNGTL